MPITQDRLVDLIEIASEYERQLTFAYEILSNTAAPLMQVASTSTTDLAMDITNDFIEAMKVQLTISVDKAKRLAAEHAHFHATSRKNTRAKQHMKHLRNYRRESGEPIEPTRRHIQSEIETIDYEPNVPCPSCGSDHTSELSTFYKEHPLPFILCLDCGFNERDTWSAENIKVPNPISGLKL